MINFECDYTEGAYPEILKRMLETNEEQSVGYGVDSYCDNAKDLIRKACKQECVEVHFLVGGTQTNTTVIASVLRPYQGVISATSGHIACHETGAIEATGHKVIALEGEQGKLSAQQVRQCYEAHYKDEAREHTTQPGMVYISNPTEYGTLYSKGELQELSKVCKECELPLYLDGARLGYGLMAEGYDVTLADIARLCDIFYIGGTKQGALFGEAVVVVNQALVRDFRYMMKQQGAMLAKGWLLGIQFQVLFETDVYFTLAKQANELASRLKKAFVEKGYSLYIETWTNQIFVIMKEKDLMRLRKEYGFSIWEQIDEEHIVVRFCTSWSTKEEHVKRLICDL